MCTGPGGLEVRADEEDKPARGPADARLPVPSWEGGQPSIPRQFPKHQPPSLPPQWPPRDRGVWEAVGVPGRQLGPRSLAPTTTPSVPYILSLCLMVAREAEQLANVFELNSAGGHSVAPGRRGCRGGHGRGSLRDRPGCSRPSEPLSWSPGQLRLAPLGSRLPAGPGELACPALTVVDVGDGPEGGRGPRSGGGESHAPGEGCHSASS